MVGLLGVLGQLAPTSERESLVMDPENPADSSHSHPFYIELTGLLLEGWIFDAGASERSVGRLGNESAGHPDWCHSE